MKATGIVRRVDDLGRVVIPKEIRRVCNIREGDPLEIFLQDGAVVFEKYNPDYKGWTCSEIRQELHSMRELEGWYECEVCDEIRKFFN